MSTPDDIFAQLESDCIIVLQTLVRDGDHEEAIVFWEGTSTEWMMDAPAILETLAIATKMAQQRMLDELE